MEIKNYLLLTRPQFRVMAIMAVLAAYLVASDGSIDLNILFPLVTAILLDSAGMVANDIFDAEDIDKGRTDKLIPSGIIKRDDAIVFGVFLGVGGIAVAILSGKNLMVIAACWMLIMGTIHNSKTKRYGVLGNITLGMTLASSLALIGWTGYTDQIFDLRFLFIYLTMFMLSFNSDATENFTDYTTDDILSQGRTLPIIFGVKKAASVIILTLYLELIFCVLALITAVMINLITVPIIIVLAIFPIIIYKILLESEDLKKAWKAFNITMLFNTFIIITIFIGVISKHYIGL